MSGFRKIRIVCISDTHNAAPGQGYVLPPGDILIHAGDLTNQGTAAELTRAHTFLAAAPYAVKIIVAGNHDLALNSDSTTSPFRLSTHPLQDDSNDNIIYLCHAATTITLPSTADQAAVRLRVFGSPYSPRRGEGTQHIAFQDLPGNAANARWGDIPLDVELLITHTPPAGILDASAHWTSGGCPALRERLAEVRPWLHVCGHCHEGRGAAIIHRKGAAIAATDNNTITNNDKDDGIEQVITVWQDPGVGNKKLSLCNLVRPTPLRHGHETAVVNACIMARSHGQGAKSFNKPIVVDLLVPTLSNVTSLSGE